VAIVEDQGLVLRSLRFRETSLIVVVLTRDHGKLHLIAKAARETRSPFGGALEPLTVSSLVFYLKKNRELHLLKAASVEQAYLELLRQPVAYHLASAALEFAWKVVPDEDPCPEVGAALTRFLEWCDRELPARLAGIPLRAGAEIGRARFKALQLRIVALLGYAPQVAACTRCARPIDPPAAFGVAEGGLLCGSCARGEPAVPLSPAGLGLLRALVANVPAPESSDAARREVAPIVEGFLRFHLTGYQGLRALRSLEDWLRDAPL